jgi:DNA-binding transcriptional LysR family regulator
MDRLGPLNAFVHAAESRSFTAAGRELGISASGVGKAIARLEERLGVTLFHRSTRSITLTTEGAQFLRRCEAIFGELEAAESEIAHASSTPRGKLRVSLPLIGMLMVPSLAAFNEAYPDVELELDFSDRLVDIIEEGFDAVIRTGKAVDSALMMSKVGTYSYVIVGSPAYLEQRGVPKKPEDLASHACLYHRWSASGKLEAWVFGRNGKTIDYAPAATLVASTMEPLIGLAERGRGLMYTPTFTVRRQLADGTLRSVLDPFLPSTGMLQILWPPSRHPAPRLTAFIEHMSRTLLADNT